MVRKAVVAGQFYPGGRARLEKEVESLMMPAAKRRPAIAIIVPHAGYMYSGGVAGSVYASIEPKETAVILGPNHTGYGGRFSLMSSDDWITPLGGIKINKDLANAILEASRLIKEDKAAHAHEHSIEVQLPFLQKLNPETRIVPISVSCADIAAYASVARELAEAIRPFKKDCMIIASSDMTHYEGHERVKSKDAKAIEAILKLDEAGLAERVKKYDISMCGYAPVAIALASSKLLGAGKAELVKYQTSGDVSGDYSSVVGYAGIIIS